MSKENQISLCLTTFNRFEFTVESFAQVINDGRISEIVIVDDCSTDDSYGKLQQYFTYHPKVKLFRNEKNLGVYYNKKRAIELAGNEWAILFDSDNIIYPHYIDKLYELDDWLPHICYCPDMAQIALDYRHFGGQLITRYNAGNYIDQRNGGSLFNTMNAFYNCKFYQDVFKYDIEPVAADSIQQNLNYLLNDGAMYIVEGLNYFHRIHPGSHYVNFTHKSDVYHKEITDKIRLMK